MLCLARYFSIAAFLTVFVSLSTCAAEEELSGDIEYLFTALGPYRWNDFYPGDTSHFRVPIRNFKTGDDGFASLEYHFEIRKGEELVVLIGEDSTTFQPAFGAKETSLKGHFRIPSKIAPGVYNVAATIKDRVSGASVSLNKEFKILKIDRPVPLSVRLTTDQNGSEITSGRFVHGESVFLHFFVAGVDTLKPSETCQCEISFFARSTDGVVQVGKLEKIEIKRVSSPLPVPASFMFTTEPVMSGFVQLRIRGDHDEGVITEIPFEVLRPLNKESTK